MDGYVILCSWNLVNPICFLIFPVHPCVSPESSVYAVVLCTEAPICPWIDPFPVLFPLKIVSSVLIRMNRPVVCGSGNSIRSVRAFIQAFQRNIAASSRIDAVIPCSEAEITAGIHSMAVLVLIKAVLPGFQCAACIVRPLNQAVIFGSRLPIPAIEPEFIIRIPDSGVFARAEIHIFTTSKIHIIIGSAKSPVDSGIDLIPFIWGLYIIVEIIPASIYAVGSRIDCHIVSSPRNFIRSVPVPDIVSGIRQIP